MKDFRELKFAYNSTKDSRKSQGEFCTDDTLYHFLDSFNHKERSAFNVLLRLANRYAYVNPKQGTIAGFAGYCRETINRKAKAWHEAGLLQKRFIYNEACIYTIHPRLFDGDVRQKYSHLFDAFKTFALIFLFTFGKAHVYGDVTLRTPVKRMFNLRYGEYTNVVRYTDSKRGRRSPWNMYGNEERKKLILEITKRVGLTKRGQVGLAPYPAECLAYVLDIMKSARTENIRNVWSWFISLCNSWCKCNDVRPDFGLENDLIAQFGLDQNGSKIDPNFTWKEQVSNPVIPRPGFPKRELQKPSTTPKPWQGYEKPADGAFVAGYKRGDALEAQGLDGSAEYDKARMDTKVPDYTTNRTAFGAAVNFARQVPDSIKSEWSQQYEKSPYKFDPPVIQVIKEWRLAQSKSADMILAESPADEPPLIDYGDYEETFEENED